MPFRGIVKQQLYDDPTYLVKKRRPHSANIFANASSQSSKSSKSKKVYPGATLSYHEVTFIEHELVETAQHIEPTWRDAHPDHQDHSEDPTRGSHSSECWKKQRKGLWKAYAKGCVESMLRTGQRMEPLRTESLDVPEKEAKFTCECGSAPRKFVISVFAGNVSWTKA